MTVSVTLALGPEEIISFLKISSVCRGQRTILGSEFFLSNRVE